jgi:hypothetical protein
LFLELLFLILGGIISRNPKTPRANKALLLYHANEENNGYNFLNIYSECSPVGFSTT